MLKLRSLGLSDFAVLEGGQRIGRIRLATERMPCVWLWSVTVHLPGGLPMGTAKDLDTAKLEFKAAWKALKARPCHPAHPSRSPETRSINSPSITLSSAGRL